MVRGSLRHVVAYLKDFLFKPDQAHQPVSSLSGGEKNRLMLAVALAQESNFLVLDEPTNDLDMETLDLLQEVLDEYLGTVLVVSHDRDFLDKVTTSIIYMKGDGTVEEYADTYSDILKKMKDVQPAAKKQSKKDSSLQPAKDKKQTKLSYKDQRLLEVLPSQIDDMEKQAAEIELKLSDPDFYTNNPDEFNNSSKKLSELKNQIEEAELKWLELQDLQENLN
jgi:ATP-binding cassette subfamily F protein uup